MNTFQNKYDELERIIYEDGLRIKALHFHQDIDLMVIVLNNKRVLLRPLSYTDRLKKATADQLQEYRLIANGVGVHWPQLDEDLSLKGFLKEEVTQSISDIRKPEVSR